MPPALRIQQGGKTVGESNAGKQRKSMLPFVQTSAMERIFPMTP